MTSLLPAAVRADEGMFGSIAGLPVHPLVVHLAVVFLPLAALGMLAVTFVPKWRGKYATLVLIAAVIAGVATFVAKESGEALASKAGEPGFDHAQWGDRLFFVAGIFTVAVIVWWFLRRRRGASEGMPARVLSWVASLLAVAVLVLVVITGHSGAKSVWSDTKAVGISSIQTH